MAPGLTAVAIAQMQEQRKSAAVKIAVWYKRLSETRQARQTLKAHRQLLPLTSLDKRREEEEKVAAASTIVCFLQDLQRGHSFVRAVQTFHLKVRLAVQEQTRQKKKRKKGGGNLHLFGISFMRSQVSREGGVQGDLPYTTACRLGICSLYCHALPLQS
jgi:hypothetical protein